MTVSTDRHTIAPGMPMGTSLAALLSPMLPETRWLELLNVVPRTAVHWYSGGGARADRPVPALTRTLSTATSVLLDELFATLHYVASPFDRRRLAETVALLRRAAAIIERAGWGADPAAYHRAPPAPDAVELIPRRLLLAPYEELVFASGYQPPAALPGRDAWQADAANGRAHAYVLRHDGRPRPWLIVLHPQRCGTPIDLQWMGSWALHRELGVNVIHPVLPRHGPRGQSYGAPFPTPDALTNLFGFSQALWDLRRTVAWVRGQGATAIAVHGLSLGGYLGALLAMVDGDLDCVIAGIPISDLPDLFATHAARYGASPDDTALLLDPAAAIVHQLISPLAASARVPRERCLLYASVGDRVAPPEQALALWRHWGEPPILWSQGSHLTAIFSRRAGRFVRDGLVRHGIADGAP